eukprot:GHVU01173228.1.p1 GENE.GHVU01173228.1~~GHVU01173228.1.p1  ORF type:complete len:519 (-),score=126.19 GHVU01173228.1:307-1863(-)
MTMTSAICAKVSGADEDCGEEATMEPQCGGVEFSLFTVFSRECTEEGGREPSNKEEEDEDAAAERELEALLAADSFDLCQQQHGTGREEQDSRQSGSVGCTNGVFQRDQWQPSAKREEEEEVATSNRVVAQSSSGESEARYAARGVVVDSVKGGRGGGGAPADLLSIHGRQAEVQPALSEHGSRGADRASSSTTQPKPTATKTATATVAPTTTSSRVVAEEEDDKWDLSDLDEAYREARSTCVEAQVASAAGLEDAHRDIVDAITATDALRSHVAAAIESAEDALESAGAAALPPDDADIDAEYGGEDAHDQRTATRGDEAAQRLGKEEKEENEEEEEEMEEKEKEEEEGKDGEDRTRSECGSAGEGGETGDLGAEGAGPLEAARTPFDHNITECPPSAITAASAVGTSARALPRLVIGDVVGSFVAELLHGEARGVAGEVEGSQLTGRLALPPSQGEFGCVDDASSADDDRILSSRGGSEEQEVEKEKDAAQVGLIICHSRLTLYVPVSHTGRIHIP